MVELPDAMLTERRSADVPSGVNSGYFPGGFYIYKTVFILTSRDCENRSPFL